SMVVNHLKKLDSKERTNRVACVYCEYNQGALQSPENLLASIWFQLLPHQDAVSPALRAFWQENDRGRTRPTMEQVMSVLADEVAKNGLVSVLIDAIDELESKVQRVLLQKIKSLVAIRHLKETQVRLMVSSRQERSLLPDAYIVEIVAADEDIKLFVERCIEDGVVPDSEELSTIVQDDPDLKSAIISTVVDRSKGMFLLASLYMNLLEDQISSAKLRNTIQNLPKGLGAVYGQVWKRIEHQSPGRSDLARQAIQWLSSALSQVTVDQLRHAIATREGDDDLNRAEMPATEVLTIACQGLVKIDAESKIIRLAHFTTYEFFRDLLSKNTPDTHRTLAKTCLTYLKFKIFERGPCRYITSSDINLLGVSGDIEPSDVLALRISEYPFMKYAANYWGDHARLSPEDAIQSYILAFLKQRQCLASTIQTRYAESQFAYDSDLEARYAGSLALHAAVCYGLEATVDLLLTTLTAPEINDVDCRGKTALHWAVESKSTSIALRLVHAGANLESKVRGERFLQGMLKLGNRPPLRWRTGDELDRLMPEVVAKGDLIYISVVSEQIEVLRTYLSSAHNLKEKKGRAKDVLFKASSLNRPAVVKLALEMEGFVNCRDVKGKTPLVVAVENSHPDIVQTLLHHGASLNTAHGQVVAHSLIINAVADQKVFKRRLRLIGDIIHPSPYGSTAKEPGPESYDETVLRRIRALLCDLPILPMSRWRNSHTRLLKTLHEDRSQKRIIDTLLSHGADPTVRTSEGETLVHLAVCSAGRLRTLLESPIVGSAGLLTDAIDAEDHNGRTALHYAAAANNPRAMQILLTHGADINARDNFGATALHYAVEDHECVYIALHAKPTVDARDNRGRNALHYLAMVAEDPDPENLTHFQKSQLQDSPAKRCNDHWAMVYKKEYYSSTPRNCDERTLEMLYKAFAEAQDRLPSARDLYGHLHGDYLLATRDIQFDFAETTSWLKQMKGRYLLRTAAIEETLTHAIKQATKERKTWTVDYNELLGQGSGTIKGDGSNGEVLCPGRPLENRTLVFGGDKPDLDDSRNVLLIGI
ncbi:MAG: hypothetical protein Q9183_001945, partial [Haloplaca sp. 2 TL-2023]